MTEPGVIIAGFVDAMRKLPASGVLPPIGVVATFEKLRLDMRQRVANEDDVVGTFALDVLKAALPGYKLYRRDAAQPITERCATRLWDVRVRDGL